MEESKTFDFKAFVAANADRTVSGFDYVHAVYKLQALQPDFVLWLNKLCWPEFKVMDGRIYISELFSLERFQELLKEGKSGEEVQFWMNLLEITGLFDEMSSEHALQMADTLVKSWNAKLTSEFGVSTLLARAICDEETGEIFITIGIA